MELKDGRKVAEKKSKKSKSGKVAGQTAQKHIKMEKPK